MMDCLLEVVLVDTLDQCTVKMLPSSGSVMTDQSIKLYLTTNISADSHSSVGGISVECQLRLGWVLADRSANMCVSPVPVK